MKLDRSHKIRNGWRMRLHRAGALALVLFVSSLASAAGLQNGVVTLENGEKVYTEFAAGDPAKPTIVIVNGVAYSLQKWRPLMKDLAAKGHNVLVYALPGQPENLRLLRRGEEPRHFRSGLEMDDLVDNMDMVVRALKLKGKIIPLGTSYGAPIAAEYALSRPQLVDGLVLAVPLVVSLDRYDKNGRNVRLWLENVRFWENYRTALYGPWSVFLPPVMRNEFWYNVFYEQIYKGYLDKTIQRIPEGVDPDLYKKGVFHLVRAARDVNMRELAPRLKDVHMAVAEKDMPPLQQDQMRVWKEINPSERRSLLVVMNSLHQIPESSPHVLAKWLDAVVKKSSNLRQGKTFKVPSDGLPIDLPPSAGNGGNGGLPGGTRP